MSIPKKLSFRSVTNWEALSRLVVILEQTPDENFNIGSWSCGTVHCAAGLAACDPWFNGQGFYLDQDGDVTFKRPEIDSPCAYYHWHAVAKMFNLGHPECEWLFSGHEYLNEYPEPEWTEDERSILNSNEDNETSNMLFRNIPKSAVIARLKQVLELHKDEIR